MSKPATPDKIRERIQDYAMQSTPTEFPTQKWGAMIGWLNRYLLTDSLRHLVIGWLFSDDTFFEPLRSSDLSPQQKYGISKWIGSWFNEDSQSWECRPTYPAECLAVLNIARSDYHAITGKVAEDLPFIGENGEIEGDVTGIVEDPVGTGLPEGAVWCEWCGEWPSSPGEPCEDCKRLGAQHLAEMAPEAPSRHVSDVVI